MTALSDLEYERKASCTTSNMSTDFATVRPETKTRRYSLWRFILATNDMLTTSIVSLPFRPSRGRSLQVIADAAVDPEFGTGVVKVTPAHDPQDFDIGQRHGLEIRQVIGFDGRMNAAAGSTLGSTDSNVAPALWKT